MTTSVSYWETQHFFNYDVIIIGSGIVGLSAAIAIKAKSQNISVAVLERGFLPSGASTKNAGFACFGSISELIEQEKNCGTDGLYELISRRWKGLLKLRNLLGDAAISYHNYGGYELFKSSEKELSELCVAKLSHYNHLIANIVDQPHAFRTANAKINNFGFNHIDSLIENQLEGQIDTGKMMKAMLQKAGQLGIVIFNNCTVKKIEKGGGLQTLISDNGNFTGKKVLLSTNAFIKQLLPSIDVIPGRGQVIITKPIKNLKIKGAFHYNRGYYYFRNIDNRILLGGGRNLDFKTEETTGFGHTELVQDALQNLLAEIILPHTSFEIDQAWSGIMAFGSALEPIIKEVEPNLFCAVRCNGMGIAIGCQTGEDAAELILKSF